MQLSLRFKIVGLISLSLILGAGFLATNRPAYSAVHGGSVRRPAALDPAEVTLTYASEMRGDDELVEMEPDVWVKSSNIYGVTIGGNTYYYRLAGHASFDPWSRGKVASSDIHIVSVVTEQDFAVTVYVIAGSHASARQL